MIMKRHADLRPTAVRLLTATFCSIVGLAALAAPLCASHGRPTLAAALYLAFSGVCHQIPERSFLIDGHPLAVCHRCAGVYLGLFLAAALLRPRAPRSPSARRLWVLAVVAPLALDVILERTGLWHGAGGVRFATGLLFGIGTAPLLLCGLTEWLQEIRWPAAVGDPHFKRGLP